MMGVREDDERVSLHEDRMRHSEGMEEGTEGADDRLDKKNKRNHAVKGSG